MHRRGWQQSCSTLKHLLPDTCGREENLSLGLLKETAACSHFSQEIRVLFSEILTKKAKSSCFRRCVCKPAPGLQSVTMGLRQGEQDLSIHGVETTAISLGWRGSMRILLAGTAGGSA